MNGVLFDKAQAKLLQFPGGLGGGYTIPASVTSIGVWAFNDCIFLKSVTIPASVTSIGSGAFYNCASLKSAYVLGNAPPDDGTVFAGHRISDPATVYYLVGTTGWGSTFGSVPAVLWNPQANSFSRSGNDITVQISSVTDATYQLQVTPSLNPATWTNLGPSQSGTGGVLTFTDSGGATNGPGRFYRIDITLP